MNIFLICIILGIESRINIKEEAHSDFYITIFNQTV